MNLERAQDIVNAALYEGYILYPYRPSAVKNRQRWTFGGLYPQDYSGVREGTDACRMQTQCLVQGGADAALDIRVRFLHIVAREIGELEKPLVDLPGEGEPRFRKVESLEVGGQRFYAWQEAVEREVVVPSASLDELLARPRRTPFTFPGKRELESLRAPDGRIAGILIRTQMALEGEIKISAEPAADDAFRLTVQVHNQTSLEGISEPSQVKSPLNPLYERGADRALSPLYQRGVRGDLDFVSRDDASRYAFASTHTILGVQGGELASLLDPPELLREAAAGCNNVGTYPVLVGDEGDRNTMLSSPIILYDYPQIAPESPGDLFDGTEIDEILTLRILAMTDDEKREMAATDPRAAKLLERTEGLTAEQLNKLHGTMRQLRPVSGDATGNPFDAWDAKPQLVFLRVGGRELKVGDKVRLRPKGGADIMDLALNGKIAIIEAIERDFEDHVHVAVTVDDDPGRDLGLERMPGHRFFFAPREIEPVETAALDQGAQA